MQLNSDPSARAELRANVREAASRSKPPARTYKTFPVAGIPGARGYQLTSAGGAGDNIVFADQQFLYFVGFGWSGKAQNRPTRVHSCSPPQCGCTSVRTGTLPPRYARAQRRSPLLG